MIKLAAIAALVCLLAGCGGGEQKKIDLSNDMVTTATRSTPDLDYGEMRVLLYNYLHQQLGGANWFRGFLCKDNCGVDFVTDTMIVSFDYSILGRLSHPDPLRTGVLCSTALNAGIEGVDHVRIIDSVSNGLPDEVCP